MWFKRMTLEVWFDDYQYEVKYDIGESAVKFLTLGELDIDLNAVALRYGYHKGQPPLRAEIAKQFPGLAGDHVIVTTGGSEAIFAINAALVKPGDHVIVEHPNYASLYEIPRSLGCDVSLFTLDYADNFKPNLDKLRDMITPKTRLISFTHPNNPTGSMISVEELEGLVALAEGHDIFLMFDETYRDLDFTHTLPPAATLSKKVISISTMSKCYGLPGIRIGWAVTQDEEMIEKLLTVREQISITNNALGEAIALHVLQRKEAFLEHSRQHVEANRQIVADWIDGHKYIEWIYPVAGVVSFPRIKLDVPVDPEAFYRKLVEQYKTFVIPGRCFEMDNHHFRLGFGATSEEIQTGLQNIDAALKELLP